MAAPRRRTARLVRAGALSPSVRSLTLEVEGDEPFRYVAGQYADLYVPSASGLVVKRPYSIASAPGHAGPNRVEFAITRVPGGLASDALHALPLGASLALEGPWGGFTREGARGGPALFVGAGTGLAPLRAMLQAELGQRGGPPLTLLFGCRTPADILWADELLTWPGQSPRVAVEITLSRPPHDWLGRAGYVQAHVAELCARTPPGDVYVCGLTPMVEGVVEALAAAGVAAATVHVEEYV